MAETSTKLSRMTGLVLGVVALLVYWVTLSVGPFPGESAFIMVQGAGILPLLSPGHPLWNGLAWVLTRLPVGSLAGRFNVFSALCGAVSVVLLYRLVSGFIRLVVVEHDDVRTERAALLSGISGALALAFSIPFWMVSNRGHPAAFDVLLLLVTARLLLAFSETGRRRDLLFWAFLLGLGTTEFATLILFSFLLVPCAAFLLWRSERLKANWILPAVLLWLAGLLAYVLGAWAFCGTPGYTLQRYHGFFQVIWYMWRDQYVLIVRSLPQTGWLIILIVTAVPWAAAISVANRALNAEKDFWLVVLHLVISALTIAVLLNTPLAPWVVLKESRLLVTPYVLAAFLYGYLVAYWYLLPHGFATDAERERPGLARLARGVGVAAAALGLLLVGWAPFRNATACDGREAAFANRVAAETVAGLRGRTWLVTDGVLDNNLLMAASEAKQPLKILSFGAGDSPLYLRYVATLFESPRLRSMAEVGLYALLQDWFATDPRVADEVALWVAPDLWMGAGYATVPDRLVFLGARATNSVDAASLLAEHAQFWATTVPDLKRHAREGLPLSDLAGRLLRQTSLVADDLGVFMEDAGRTNDAFLAYSEAREIREDNISALLNLVHLVDGGYPTAQTAALKRDLEALRTSRQPKPDVWALASRDGYVRTPQVFADLGMTWAYSGQPGLAVSGMKRALALAPIGTKQSLQEQLADLYFLQKKDETSAALYYELLVEDPENKKALLGLARIAEHQGKFDEARGYLDRAEKAGVPSDVMLMERAAFELAAGQDAPARVLLEKLVEIQPGNGRAWAMLADVLFRSHDKAGLANVVERLHDVEGSKGLVSEILARESVEGNDLGGARQHYADALAANPSNLRLMERLALLDLLAGRREDARSDARRLLALDGGDAVANYIMGSLQLADGDLDLAESSLRKSLERERIPEAMNDLAWLLQARGAYPEAEKLAREALQRKSGANAFWDTLGEILRKTGRLDEAADALRKGLALAPDNATVLLHLAEVEALRGNREKAADLVASLTPRESQLAAADAKRLAELRRSLEAR